MEKGDATTAADQVEVSSVKTVEAKGPLAELMDVIGTFKTEMKAAKKSEVGTVTTAAQKVVDDMESITAPVVLIPVSEFVAIKILYHSTKFKASAQKLLAKASAKVEELHKSAEAEVQTAEAQTAQA